jgi:hypothetical protein
VLILPLWSEAVYDSDMEWKYEEKNVFIAVDDGAACD